MVRDSPSLPTSDYPTATAKHGEYLDNKWTRLHNAWSGSVQRSLRHHAATRGSEGLGETWEVVT